MVGLAIDERGILPKAEDRVAIARRIRDAALAAGIPQEDIRRAIAMGICKVNVGTEIRSAYVSALYSYTQTHEKGDVRDFVKYLRAAVGTASERYMECFAAAK